MLPSYGQGTAHEESTIASRSLNSGVQSWDEDLGLSILSHLGPSLSALISPRVPVWSSVCDPIMHLGPVLSGGQKQAPVWGSQGTPWHWQRNWQAGPYWPEGQGRRQCGGCSPGGQKQAPLLGSQELLFPQRQGLSH